MKTESLNKLIEEFNNLSLEDREYAVSIIEKQLIDAKREVISIRVKEALGNYKKGICKTGSVSDLYKDLEGD
jgi:hypothetical protein